MKKLISLSVKCPLLYETAYGRRSIDMQGYPSIKLNIRTGKHQGVIHLCSVYECYDLQSDIPLEKGEIVEFNCPHCNKKLMVRGECNLCGSLLVSLLLQTGGSVSLCSRNGCSNHFVAFEDISTELTGFYQEYGD